MGTYGETYLPIEAHLRWEAFCQLKRTYNGNGSNPSPGMKLARKIIALRKCTYGQDLYNSADLLWWLWWLLRAQLLWTIEVHLPTLSHTVHELYVRDVHGERQHFRALTDPSATSIFMVRDCFGDLDSHHNRYTWPFSHLETGQLCRRKIVKKRQSCLCLFVLMMLYSLYLEHDSSLIPSDNLMSVYWTLGAGWRTGCPRCAYYGL